jgi:hypothetical protein
VNYEYEILGGGNIVGSLVWNFEGSRLG